MKLKALILDLGNVLAFHDNALLFREMAKSFGTTVDEVNARVDSSVWHAVNTGGLPHDALRAALQQRLGGQVSFEEFNRVWNVHFTLHHEMIREVEGLLGRYKLVLLSNTHDLHFNFLRPQLPVLEKFDGLVVSYEVGAMKPDARIYQRALEVAGVAPHEAAFFDDIQAYADAATKLGINGRLYTDVAKFRRDLEQLG